MDFLAEYWIITINVLILIASHNWLNGLLHFFVLIIAGTRIDLNIIHEIWGVGEIQIKKASTELLITC